MTAAAATPVPAEVRMAVAELNADYAACLDDRRFDEWPEYFTDECVYRLQPRENHDRGLPLATMASRARACCAIGSMR
jgi:salicylate 5-hydroxylase small subunit